MSYTEVYEYLQTFILSCNNSIIFGNASLFLSFAFLQILPTLYSLDPGEEKNCDG